VDYIRHIFVYTRSMPPQRHRVCDHLANDKEGTRGICQDPCAVIHLLHLMANVLPDRDIQTLIGTVIIGGSEDCVRVNAYEVRLGYKAKFDSTGEEIEIPQGHFLEIEPGDFVTVQSLEELDFRLATVTALGKPNGMFAWITPTTTMMREGFLFASTKVDAGYKGHLNWGIRNSSIKTVKLQQGEHIFKLTIMELSAGEKPDKFYGDGKQDHYQGTSGIKESARLIPADIPDHSIVRRTQRKVDPMTQLTQAGYPFNHIGTELITLKGELTIVSSDVAAMKSGLADFQRDIGDKIVEETGKLSDSITKLGDKIDKQIGNVFREQFHLYFDQRMQRVIGIVATLITFAAALYKGFIQPSSPRNQFYYLIGIGFILLIGTLTLTRSSHKPKS
jgi:deoxycytidine triphosphate deaminase